MDVHNFERKLSIVRKLKDLEKENKLQDFMGQLLTET